MSHHKGGFEPETNGFQFYAIANLDKTSLNLILLCQSTRQRCPARGGRQFPAPAFRVGRIVPNRAAAPRDS